MSSIQKLVNHWKQGQFIPGGNPPQPLNNEVKGQRLSELNGDDMIVPEITKGISILKDVVEALKTTQEFNKDPSSFSGDARDVLMSDDFLLVADVLRLIFPEGMISDVWQLKRGRDEDLDTRDDPMPKRLRFTNGPEAQVNKTPRNRQILVPMPRFTKGPEAQENKTQRLRFTNGPESQPEKKPWLFSMPASQAEATGYTGIFGAKDKNSLSASQQRFMNGPETQAKAIGYNSIFGAKDKDKGSEKVSDTPPTPPQTGGIFSTTSPGPEHTESSSQYIGSLSGNNKEATLDNLLSSMGDDDVNKILAQLQLYQQGTKRKYKEEKETLNKMRNNIEEPYSLIKF